MITINEFRNLLDEEGLSHKRFGDDKFALPVNLGEVRFNLLFSIEKNCISCCTIFQDPVMEFERTAALEFCNTWNAQKRIPKAYTSEEQRICAEHTVALLGEVSPDFVKKNVIHMNIVSFYQFIETLRKYQKTGVFED